MKPKPPKELTYLDIEAKISLPWKLRALFYSRVCDIQIEGYKAKKHQCENFASDIEWGL